MLPIASYHYTDGSGPSAPEPENNWRVRQQITDARWSKRKKTYITKGIDDFGDKYERDWNTWQREANVKFVLGDNEGMLEPRHAAWEIAGGSGAVSIQKGPGIYLHCTKIRGADFSPCF